MNSKFGQIQSWNEELAALDQLKNLLLKNYSKYLMTCWLSGERSLPFGPLVSFMSEKARVYILKPSSNRSLNIFTLFQKVKIRHTKRFYSKDKSRLCRDFAGYLYQNDLYVLHRRSPNKSTLISKSHTIY